MGCPAGAPCAGPSWALNSAVECHLHTVEVAGSNPAAPTMSINYLSHVEHPSSCTLGHMKGGASRPDGLASLPDLPPDHSPEHWTMVIQLPARSVLHEMT